MSEYPTKKELETIKKWDLSKQGVHDFLEFLESIWHFGNWGFILKGKHILHLQLHTGGWSGNEDIIQVLRSTFFWIFFWTKSLRGGHYYFRIRKMHGIKCK